MRVLRCRAPSSLPLTAMGMLVLHALLLMLALFTSPIKGQNDYSSCANGEIPPSLAAGAGNGGKFIP